MQEDSTVCAGDFCTETCPLLFCEANELVPALTKHSSRNLRVKFNNFSKRRRFLAPNTRLSPSRGSDFSLISWTTTFSVSYNVLKTSPLSPSKRCCNNSTDSLLKKSVTRRSRRISSVGFTDTCPDRLQTAPSSVHEVTVGVEMQGSWDFRVDSALVGAFKQL